MKTLEVLAFFWSRDYRILLAAAVISAFCLIIFRRAARKSLPQIAQKIVYGIIFLPLVLLPVFKCCFKVPYVFCRVCPSKCPWGISRAFIFGSFLALNLSGKFWCASMCPFGSIQECQAKILKPGRALSFRPTIMSYPVLLLTTWMYSLTLFGSGMVSYFIAGYYTWVWTTMLAAALILAAAFFVPRFWCRNLCPVGAIAGLTSGRT